MINTIVMVHAHVPIAMVEELWAVRLVELSNVLFAMALVVVAIVEVLACVANVAEAGIKIDNTNSN